MFLGIDSSLGTAVALVSADGQVVAEASRDDPLAHAEAIGDLLAAVTARGEVAHVAVGMGPGPFTGLRVGIAAARAFALGRGVDVVPVVSHDAVALGMLGDAGGGPGAPFAIVTDARRRELAFTVYSGLDADGLPARLSESALIARDALDAHLATLDAMRVDAVSVPATMVALAAARAVAAGRSIGPGEPLYLRSPDVAAPAARKSVVPTEARA